ncbi:BQ5605_C016g08044 [Microbotryum silenes-dioicae]|uniref:BQ5605_C016g08044 protein n=2 Tax=Microbotryum TaxID=34416 RepID=A0A2X0LZ36_9BASI|nr:BQ5605_C016g08044 [Microbotryum silenes-dioicae]
MSASLQHAVVIPVEKEDRSSYELEHVSNDGRYWKDSAAPLLGSPETEYDEDDWVSSAPHPPRPWLGSRFGIRLPDAVSDLASRLPGSANHFGRPLHATQWFKLATVLGLAATLIVILLWMISGRDHEQKPAFMLAAFRNLEFPTSHGLLMFPARRRGSSEVPQEQPHPIHLLLAEAREKWDHKVAVQSKTLEDAVEEYKRRYDMNPPLGFDKWFEWATQHDCQLLDEYDSIHRRILPFHSLSGETIRARAKEMQDEQSAILHNNWFAIDIEKDGKSFEVRGPMPRFNVDMLREVRELIPFDLTLTFNGQDEPKVLVRGEAFQRHMEHALAHEFMPEEEERALLIRGEVNGYMETCPPGSAIRTAGRWDKIDFVPDLTRPTSFIEEHRASMSFCDWPANEALHGSSFRVYPSPELLRPVFSCSVMAMHHDLLIPTVDQYDWSVGPDPSWYHKEYNKVLWRGSTTGTDGDDHTMKYSQRFRLTHLTRQTGNISLMLAQSDTDNGPGPTTIVNESISMLANKYFDFSFTGEPIQCSEEACKKMAQHNQFKEVMYTEEQNKYKYVIDVDGNGWSGRFHRLMRSNTMVLKSTIFPEWYTDRIQPWLHYVPVKVDYTDLIPIMAFFMGDLEGRGAHDYLGERIATRGRLWTEMYWRYEDMQAYFLRLVLEYGRVSSKEYPTDTRFDYIASV